MQSGKPIKERGGIRIILVLVLLGFVLFLFVRYSGRFSGPEIELVDAPTMLFSNTEQPLVWEVTLPKGFISASQFTLHLDEEAHYGSFGTKTEPSKSGYTRTLYTEPEVLEDGSLRVTFTIYERKPVLLYYRLHLLVDGKHYWTPESALSIRHKPAFLDEFKETHLKEALEHLALLG